MKNKIIIISTLALVALLIWSNTAFAQPFNPPDGTPGGPVGAPIDGGITALIAAGAALIGRKFYKDRKKNKQE